MNAETHVHPAEGPAAEPGGGNRSVLPSPRHRRSGRIRPGDLAIDVVLTAFGLFMILPLLLLVANAFETPAEMLAWPPTLIPNDPTTANLTAVLSSTPLLRWVFNSLAFAVLSALSITATSAVAGYLMAKFP